MAEPLAASTIPFSPPCRLYRLPAQGLGEPPVARARDDPGMPPMTALLLRRLGSGLLVLWLVHLLTFAALRAMPGDPWSDLAGDRTLPAAAVARLKRLYGQDQPVLVQYLRDLADKVQGDFGYSLKIAHGQPVIGLLARATPVSLAVGSGALLVGLFLGLWAGTLAARSARATTGAAQLG